jgi:hypothetical protein
MRLVVLLCLCLSSGLLAVRANETDQVQRGERGVRSHLKGQAAEGFRPSVVLARLRSEGTEALEGAAVGAAPATDVLRKFERLGNLQVIRIPDGESPDHFVRRLMRSGRYAFVEPDRLTRPHRLPSDPEFTSGVQWALNNFGQNLGLVNADIDAPEAWNLRTDSAAVTVAVIDAGAYLAHPDLAPNLWRNPGESGSGKETNGVDDDGNGYIDDVHGINALVPLGQQGGGDPSETEGEGHGTAVAGIIGAVGDNGQGIAGVSWRASIMPLKFRGSAATGTVSDAIECLDYALAKGARVVNASYGLEEYSQAEFEALQRLRDAGVVVVASAGNDGVDTSVTPVYPGSHLIENVVAVGSSSRSDIVPLSSNYGVGTVDLVAPGVAIRTLGMTAETPLTTVSGTSFAAAHVSGALAILRAQYPSDTATESIHRLLSGTDRKSGIYTLVHTGGRLNLAKSLASAPRPFHDDFVNGALLVGDYVSVRTSTVGATRQPGEPNHAVEPGTGGSVWWAWLANETATYRIDTLGSAIDTRLAVYEGTTMLSLRPVVSNDDDGEFPTSRVLLNATKGTIYVFAVEGKSAPGGLVVLNIAIPLTNDAFSTATAVSGPSFRIAGSNRGATPESSEPTLSEGAGGRTVWYRWVAPKTRRYQASVFSNEIDAVLGVYRGTGIKTLAEIATNNDGQNLIYDPLVSFDAIEGQTYTFAVDSIGPGGTFTLSLVDSEWQKIVFGAVFSPPTAQPGEGVVIIDDFGTVTSVSSLGEERWSHVMNGYGTYGAAAVAPDGTVVVGDAFGQVYALTPDGKRKWSHAGSGAFHASPAIGRDGTIFARGERGPLYALNPDGTLKWQNAIPGESYTSPTVAADGGVYIGSSDRILRAFEPDGSIRWTFDAEGEIYSSPAIDAAGVLYFGTTIGRLVALNPNGTLKWQYQLGGGTSSSPALGEDGTVYLGTYEGKVVAIKSDGTLRWETKVASDIRTTSPVVASDGSIYIGTTDGTLVALNRDGTVRRTYYFAEQVRSSPLIHNGMLYIGGSDYRLYAIRLDLDEASSPWPTFRQNSRRTGTPVERALRVSLQPRPARVVAGGSVTLAIAAAGADTVTYQWRVGGVAIPGATGTSLTLTDLQTNQGGVYTVLVTDSKGSLSSEGATVVVDGTPLPSGNASRLANLSVRSTAGQGDRTLIVGFSVQRGPKSLLIRGVGPALAAFGVPGTVLNPRLEVIGASSQILDRNDNWRIEDAARFLSVGAFALTPGSKDAALITPVFPGSYSARLDTVEPGVALVELYDLDPAGTETGPRLFNVSARSQVGTGGDVLIAGFVIVGDGPRRVLLRAVGPTLGGFGVAGVLADPTLELYRGEEKIATNDNWDTDDGRGAGAFPLAAGSKDAVIIRTLQPGAYSAKVAGVDDTTGVALIEVYEW